MGAVCAPPSPYECIFSPTWMLALKCGPRRQLPKMLVRTRLYTKTGHPVAKRLLAKTTCRKETEDNTP